MSYQQLSLSSFIKEMKEVTVGTHPRKFCFILGAGSSRTSGIKSGQELVKIWDKELQERNEDEYKRWRKELSITDDNMYGFYSQYYEKRFSRCPTDGYNYIEKIMDSAKPSAGYVMLAHLLTHTPHNVVITTNFDHLTEDAVNYYAQHTPLVIGHESLAHYVSALPVRPTVIKIHRDLLFDPKSRVEDLEKLPDSWKNALELIFENYHPVFIGYAGNDKSLMDFLVENGDKFANDEWKYPYWMLYKTDSIEGQVKEFLKKSEGLYIRHGGFDEVLIQIGAAFDYKIPDEDDFLVDARNRYKALADAFDALSDSSKIINKPNVILENTSKSSELVKENDDLYEDKSNVNQAIEKIISKSEMNKMYLDTHTLYKEGNYEKAAEILKELVKLEDNNARYHARLGTTLMALDKNEEAIAEYRIAVKLNPGYAWYHSCLGDALLVNKEYEEAQKEIEKAIELDPESSWYHYNLSELYYEIGEIQYAQKAVEQAIELEPTESWYHNFLGKILLKNERYEYAQKAVEKAIELEPENGWYYNCLANIFEEMGQLEKAQDMVKKAIEITPDKPFYKNYLDELTQMILDRKKLQGNVDKSENKNK